MAMVESNTKTPKAPGSVVSKIIMGLIIAGVLALIALGVYQLTIVQSDPGLLKEPEFMQESGS